MQRDKKTDRRSVYTRTLIKDIFLELLESKPYNKITVTEICKLAEINRGTFYLHYFDVDNVLDDILDEVFLETKDPLNHVMCEKKLDGSCTYPFCERIHEFPQYKALFLDESLNSRLLKKVSEAYKEKYITYLMQHSNLTFTQAEAVFLFQMNGCLSINRHMLKENYSDYKAVQKVVDKFIKAGIESFIVWK